VDQAALEADRATVAPAVLEGNLEAVAPITKAVNGHAVRNDLKKTD
jgi:hypothetical protein